MIYWSVFYNVKVLHYGVTYAARFLKCQSIGSIFVFIVFLGYTEAGQDNNDIGKPATCHTDEVTTYTILDSRAVTT